MAGQRMRLARSILIGGKLLWKEAEDFTPPDVKKSMTDTKGGSMLPGQIMTGLEKMTTKYQIAGATLEVLNEFGLKGGEKAQITVKDSYQDEDGEKFAIIYKMTGEIMSMTASSTKVSEKPTYDIEQAVDAYKMTEGGKIIYDIDRSLPKCDLGKGDLLADHRRNVGL